MKSGGQRKERMMVARARETLSAPYPMHNRRRRWDVARERWLKVRA